jgi:ribosomal-protein-serine acetyltransferase
MFSHRLSDKAELRLPETYEAEEIFAIADKNRAYLRPWMGWVNDTKGPEDIRNWIIKSREKMVRDEGFQAGIFYDGRYVGGCGYAHMHLPSKRCELGYWIDQDHQGRGIVTMAARALIEYSIEKRGLNRVEIRCDPRNVRSAAIAQRLGFKLDGVLRENTIISEQTVDMAVWSMLSSEWKILKAETTR